MPTQSCPGRSSRGQQRAELLSLILINSPNNNRISKPKDWERLQCFFPTNVLKKKERRPPRECRALCLQPQELLSAPLEQQGGRTTRTEVGTRPPPKPPHVQGEMQLCVFSHLHTHTYVPQLHTQLRDTSSGAKAMPTDPEWDRLAFHLVFRAA